MEVQPRNLPSPLEGEGCNQGFCDISDAGEGLRRVRGAKESLARKRANPSPRSVYLQELALQALSLKGRGKIRGLQ